MSLDLEFQELAKHSTKFHGGPTSPPMFFCKFVGHFVANLTKNIKPFLHDLQKKLNFKRTEQNLPCTIFFTFDFLKSHA